MQTTIVALAHSALLLSVISFVYLHIRYCWTNDLEASDGPRMLLDLHTIDQINNNFLTTSNILQNLEQRRPVSSRKSRSPTPWVFTFKLRFLKSTTNPSMMDSRHTDSLSMPHKAIAKYAMEPDRKAASSRKLGKGSTPQIRDENYSSILSRLSRIKRWVFYSPNLCLRSHVWVDAS